MQGVQQTAEVSWRAIARGEVVEATRQETYEEHSQAASLSSSEQKYKILFLSGGQLSSHCGQLSSHCTDVYMVYGKSTAVVYKTTQTVELRPGLPCGSAALEMGGRMMCVKPKALISFIFRSIT